jgi:hypothetical protein
VVTGPERAGGTVIPMTVNYISRPDPKGPKQHETWPSPPDPGDLSKRVAQRRAELGLSTAQAAARARMGLRYLEYLERYLARPTPAALRQLAAALQTTPTALLGAGADAPVRLPRCSRARRCAACC